MEKDYEVICTLGEGSFGKVYKARHRRLGDEVAVKQIKIGSRSWEEACRSTELQALKALRHPFIVKLKELIRGQKDGSLYYIFEFLDSDLCRLLKYNSNGLEELRAAALMRQLFAGLAHMHQHNFFHRDIKPENILLDVASETIRLADFGQARSLRARPPFTDYVGTRWYRAPECLLRDRSYSSPVDIWACGLIFAELLRGSPLFCGNSSIDQLYKIFTVLGPAPMDWPDFAKLTQALRFRVPDRSCGLVRVVPQCTSKCIGFLTEILALNPRRRPLAKKCLEHVYFGNLPALDLDRLDAASQGQMQNSINVENDQPDTSQLQSLQSVFEDASEDKSLISDERIQSKQSSASIRTDLAKDLDLDAELDAILGDDNLADLKQSPVSSPPRGFKRAATLPNLPSDSPAKNLTHAGSFESLPSTRRKATEEYNTEASTVATPEDHLDRLLESLDNEETSGFDDDTRNENTKSPEEAEVERLAAESKAEIDRLEAEAAEAVAKAEAQRLEEEAIAQAAKRIAVERAAKSEADRRKAEIVAKAEEEERIAQAEQLVAEAHARAEAQRRKEEAAAKAEALRIASEKAARIAAEKRAAEAVAKAEVERSAAKAAKAEAEAEVASTLEVERVAIVEVEEFRAEAFAKLDADHEIDAERSAFKPLQAETEWVPSDIRAQEETERSEAEAIREGDVESLPVKTEAHCMLDHMVTRKNVQEVRAQIQFHRSDVIPSDCEDKLQLALSGIQDVPTESNRTDLELEQLRAENATLKELLGSKASGTAFDLRNASTTVSETGATMYYAMDDGETSKSTSLKSKCEPWGADEAKLLRKVVKRIIRKGTRDKVALWTEVSLELGGGRSAKECKEQYKRDYLAHKAKATEPADVETAI